MGRLSGKVAIVTGAASRGEGVGNGAAAAILFAREGAKVVLVNRDLAKGQKLEQQIRAEGGEATAYGANVTQEADTKAMAAFAVEKYGRLDILHNNVGIGGAGNAETVDLGYWDKVVQTNLTAALLSARACIPHMRAGGGGSIINVSSTVGATGMRGETGAVAYAASKAGMHGLTLSLAADYAAEQIRANCLIVGTVYTPMVAHLGPEGRERRRKSVPLQIEGTGFDVGWAAVYLASDEARWVTGVLLPIDGGFLNVRQWPR
jgi:NAD(P)-dependent dehydrogenase (short-subunit alcohol dehydrogenase family)